MADGKDDGGTGGRADTSTGVDRRRALQYLASGTLAASLGLAGCVQSTESGDGGGGGGATEEPTSEGGGGGATSTDGDGGATEGTESDGSADIGTVTFGVLVPTSGPSAPLGKAQRRGAELGVQYVNESDEFDFEIDADLIVMGKRGRSDPDKPAFGSITNRVIGSTDVLVLTA